MSIEITAHVLMDMGTKVSIAALFLMAQNQIKMYAGQKGTGLINSTACVLHSSEQPVKSVN